MFLATSMSMIKANKKDNVILYWVLCIYNLIWFKKNEVLALIDVGNKVTTITLVYILKQDF